MDINEITLYQIVTFAIIMENGQGILGKSPDYIKEKFEYCMRESDPEYLEGVLDYVNQAKLHRWRDRWKYST